MLSRRPGLGKDACGDRGGLVVVLNYDLTPANVHDSQMF